MKPWTVLRRKKLLQDRWISLRADDCETAEGAEVAPYYVFEYPDWVNLVAVTELREVVLVRQYRHAVSSMVLELPGGSIDAADTSPEVAARRELLEETGYGGGAFVATSVILPNAASHDNRTHCFVATDCRKLAEPALEDSETLETVLVPLDEFVELVLAGGLPQAQHISSAMFALQALGVLCVASTNTTPCTRSQE